MQEKELIPHLFRTEYSKITSVLCKTFGIAHLEVAEDIASDTFLQASETWAQKGAPENPVAWLYTVAKNKTKNYLSRKELFQNKIVAELSHQDALQDNTELDFSEQNIKDSLLQMVFAICHPLIPKEAQVGLALRVLCGFSINEIAYAFLTSKDVINKRLYRAKEKLRTERVAIEFPNNNEIGDRMDGVMTTLYLLFNEGYYSTHDDTIVRKDLCAEAMRLTYLLLNNESTNLPEVNAVFALMSFQASRFDARSDKNGEVILYEDQDESLWDKEIIAQGKHYLKQAFPSRDTKITRYHLEAGIASFHTQKKDTKEKWESILKLYNQLLMTSYSPIAALNRTYVLSKVYGKKHAIAEAEKLQLTNNRFYYALLGELYHGINNKCAIEHLEQALKLSVSDTDKKTITDKIAKIKQ